MHLHVRCVPIHFYMHTYFFLPAACMHIIFFPLRFSDASSRSGLTDFSPTVISIVHPKFNPKFNSGGETAQGASPGQVKTYVERGACRVDRQLVLFEVFRPKSELSEAFVRMSQTGHFELRTFTLNFSIFYVYSSL